MIQYTYLMQQSEQFCKWVCRNNQHLLLTLCLMKNIYENMYTSKFMHVSIPMTSIRLGEQSERSSAAFHLIEAVPGSVETGPTDPPVKHTTLTINYHHFQTHLHITNKQYIPSKSYFDNVHRSGLAVELAVFLGYVCTADWGFWRGNWTYPSKWLCHLPQKVLGKLHCLINGQVKAAICDVFLNPAG